MNAITPAQQPSLEKQERWQAFDTMIRIVKDTVADSSKRVYDHTFNGWAMFCEQRNIHPLNIRQEYVIEFLSGRDTTTTTRKRELSIMRRLAQFVSIANPGNAVLRSAFEILSETKAPEAGAAQRKRRKRALTPDEANKVLEVWSIKNLPKDQPLVVKRNRAMIAVLLATGIRRSELAKLKCRDIQIQEGIMHVWDGKGSKDRKVAMVGEFWREPLHDWLEIVGPDRNYAFPPIFKNHLGSDKEPVVPETIYQAVKRTERLSGLKIAPHDFRRTHITSLLNSGAALQDVQAQAGHAGGATTMLYAQPADALARRKKFTVEFGKAK